MGQGDHKRKRRVPIKEYSEDSGEDDKRNSRDSKGGGKRNSEGDDKRNSRDSGGTRDSGDSRADTEPESERGSREDAERDSKGSPENPQITLNELISLLKTLYPEGKIQEGKTYKFQVQNPALLITSLEELQQMVGHNKLKQSIAMQIASLVVIGPKKGSMLNTMLCGPPGVGKTQVGGILAKIWSATGYLKGGSVSEEIERQTKSQDSFSGIILVFLLLLLIYLAFFLYGMFVPHMSSAYAIGLTVLVILIIFGILFWRSEPTETPPVKKSKDPKDSQEYVVFADAADLVGRYVGETAIKTKDVLIRSMGKALIIDESYRLNTSIFGKECLDTINQFLSEHPNEIIVVFAGYEKDLAELLRTQQGLRRRFMNIYRCDTYGGKELAEIFLLQLRRGKLDVESESRVRALFTENSDAFPGNGGDTDRLCYFCQTIYANDVLLGQHPNERKLNTTQIERALQMLQDSNSLGEGESSQPNLHDIIRSFQRS